MGASPGLQQQPLGTGDSQREDETALQEALALAADMNGDDGEEEEQIQQNDQLEQHAQE